MGTPSSHPERVATPSTDPEPPERAAEQTYVGTLYNHLDRLRVAAARALARAVGGRGAGTPGAQTERDAFVRMYSERVRRLDDVEERLCFGRLDLRDGSPRYIGRVGISDAERTELLVDWRAPAAEPFYQATAAVPGGVVRRRPITTRARTVTALSDEVLDLAYFAAHGASGSRVVIGEGALFASLDAARTGRMGDIVATIQADQDRVIRASLPGVLVVQGGPGTGKTAVALHRAAFLLYAHRERIERSGVLLVGPNRIFLRYIERVLPTLGEAEAMVTATPGELFPGVVTTAEDAPNVAALKGDLRMAGVVAEAVRRRQRALDRSRRMVVNGVSLTLRPHDVAQAREHARRTRAPHNQARTAFVREILNGLVRQLARARGTEVDEEVRADLLGELHEAPDVRREVNWCWAPIGADRLLRDLFADPRRLQEAARGLTAAERTLLRRDRSAPWTVSDVPLLDEAAELLGDDPTRGRRRRGGSETAASEGRRGGFGGDGSDGDGSDGDGSDGDGSDGDGSEDGGVSASDIDYAGSVQDAFGGAEFISAKDLAGRYGKSLELGTVAERAGADRRWTYGHVIVDEAQELSAMMWRLLMRRCPTRSMTVVGDVAQTGSAAGTRSWAETFAPHVEDRWRVAELSVNYRTPAQIMDLAAAVLRASGSSVVAPRSARSGSSPPQFVTAHGPTDTVEDVVATAIIRLWEERTEGTIGVLTSRAAHRRVAGVVAAALPPGAAGADSAALSSPVSTLTVSAAKGLEFDTVLIVEPGEIATESPRGINDLYVALTRSTQRLVLAHVMALPPGLDGAPERSSDPAWADRRRS